MLRHAWNPKTLGALQDVRSAPKQGMRIGITPMNHPTYGFLYGNPQNRLIPDEQPLLVHGAGWVQQQAGRAVRSAGHKVLGLGTGLLGRFSFWCHFGGLPFGVLLVSIFQTTKTSAAFFRISKHVLKLPVGIP